MEGRVETLKKVIDIVRSQQASGATEPTIEQLRTGMEKLAERVTSDVHCEPTIAGNVKAEWVVPPGADTERVLAEVCGYTDAEIAALRARQILA